MTAVNLHANALRFKNISIDDVEKLQNATSSTDTYSDFNFVSLFTWNINKNSEYLIHNGNILLKFREYTSKEISYAFYGLNDIDNSLKVLATKLGIKTFRLVPEICIRQTKDQTLTVAHDRDNDDYIYSLRELALLEGPEYRKLRRSISNFKTKNDINATLELISEQDSSTLDQILSLTKKWKYIRGREFSDASNEYFAIRRAIKFYSRLPIDVWAYKDNQKLLGFIITERVDKNTALLHYEKANTQIPGVSTVMKRDLFAKLLQEGYEYLNYEQDLGIPGLRQAKLALAPITYRKKFTVVLDS